MNMGDFDMVKVMVMMIMMAGCVMAQFEEEEEQYRGQLIGSLNSYHHQVTNKQPNNQFLFRTFYFVATRCH